MHPDKIAAIDWARQLLAADDWLICDTETSGLGLTAEIVQIAFIDRHGRIHLDMLIKPVDGIPVDAEAIHGISNDMGANAPSFVDAWPVISHLLTKYHPVIFNVRYDLGVVVGELERHGIDRPSLHGACAMKKYADFCGEQGRYGDWKWQKLPGGDHSAIGDCKSVLALIHKMSDAKMEGE